MSLRLPLPGELNALLGGDEHRPADGDNVGLWLDKFLRVRGRADRGQDSWVLEKDERLEELRVRICRASFGASKPQRSPAAAAAVERLRAMASTPHVHPHAWTARGTTRGRLVVDHGRASAHELSVSMHHVFGCPRIPGSALKGLARAWMVEESVEGRVLDLCFGRDQETRKNDGRRGGLVFYDALPVDGTFTLATNVLTPHYGKYYQGAAPPAEWLSPVPHSFVTVVETTFEFVIGVMPTGEGADWANMLETVASHLADALREEGIGAKRAAGYGRVDLEGGAR